MALVELFNRGDISFPQEKKGRFFIMSLIFGALVLSAAILMIMIVGPKLIGLDREEPKPKDKIDMTLLAGVDVPSLVALIELIEKGVISIPPELKDFNISDLKTKIIRVSKEGGPTAVLVDQEIRELIKSVLKAFPNYKEMRGKG
jgi:hypothetical protein